MTYNKFFISIVAQDIILKAYTSSPHKIPRLKIINLHTSPGGDVDTVLASGGILMIISGQYPQWTRAHAAMAGFKLREGQLLGSRVSLRNSYMWNFLEKLLTISWTQSREYTGIHMNQIDIHGQFSVGCNDLLIFPELEYIWDIVSNVDGLDINFVSSHKQRRINSCLWSALNIPVKT